MDYETIELTTEKPVATIRLNRPERMNAVIEEMYLEIQDALSRCETDAKTRCVIVTGSVLERKGVAKQAFCAGADLKHHAAGTRTEAQRDDYIRLAHETTRKIHKSPKPIIAAVNGPARGAGAELALNCDFILMADEATLGFPEIGLGTFVGGGVTRILPRLIGLSRAKELVYTGRVINGTEAVALGLALASHRAPDLLTEARKMALELSEKAPVSVVLAKRHLHESPDLRQAEAILECMKTEDWQEGLRAFSENRKPKFLGR
jgi:enoyl-CoA hydratase